MHCDDVVIMPRNITNTFGRDSKSQLLDIHTFQRFFTYQIPTKENSNTNAVTLRFDPKVDMVQPSSSNDLILRLRASLRAANMDNTDQGMKVTVKEEASGTVVVDGTTEDYDERRVHLDSVELSSSKVYIIKYVFYSKNVGMKSFEDKSVSAGHMGAIACSKPFVIQELVISSKDLIEQRANRYHEIQNMETKIKEKKLGGSEFDITKIGEHCEFSGLNNEKQSFEHGESGLYCSKKTYTYELSQSTQELQTVYTKDFSVIGAQKEAVTYLFDLTLGFDFATAAQLKAVVMRVDHNANGELEYDPLKCLYDHSCIETETIGKNEVGIQAILTSGDYKLVIFDQQEGSQVRKWLQRDVRLTQIPFTFDLQATPVVQNEERVMCGDKLYLSENFIQNRFIDFKEGQKFVFDDDIILNLVNSSQSINITPEKNMILKISAKEAYGVNMAITLCQSPNCEGKVQSQKVGNTEILFAKVKAGQQYQITLDYSHSIIELSSYYDCPHVRLTVAMHALDSARNQLDSKSVDIQKKEKESMEGLGKAFGLLSQAAQMQGAAFMMSGPDMIYTFDASRGNDLTSAVSRTIASGDFVIPAGTSRQVLVEIYFDPQFYDLELLLESKDTSEVRAHLYSGKTNTDLRQYKGAKRVFVEAESGNYKFSIIAKMPALTDELKEFAPHYIECQLYAVAAETIPSRILRPASLNYFGLLGPAGQTEGFGQFIYHLPEVILDAREFIDLEFNLTGANFKQEGGPSIDVQAIETDGKGDQLDISLRDISPGGEIQTSVPSEGVAANKVEKHPSHVVENKHPAASKYEDSWEEGVVYEALAASSLQPGTLYRVRLANRDSAELARCSLKIVVSEHFQSKNQLQYREIVPKDFDEVARVKPKVPGVKEGAFIQGSRQVMETFKVTSLSPFLPKSSTVYQAEFRTGAGTDDSFTKSLEFEITGQTTQIYAQITEYSGKEDLFISIYSATSDGSDGQRQVARSSLGKYANALGPVTLTKGKYRLVIHPDQDSTTLERSTELIRFGLDVLLEKPASEMVSYNEGASAGQFDVIVEEVELCGLPALPEDFNGPGFIHPLTGNGIEIISKYRIAQVLEGTHVTFELSEASLVIFYLALPPGLKAEAALVRLQGTRTTRVSTDDLNKDDESFLRREGGFKHRGVIQLREFLAPGKYSIRIVALENSRAPKIMARCEAYDLGLTVSPLKDSAQYPIDTECSNSQYIPERLKFDEVAHGSLVYPVSKSTVDVAYLDLKGDGEGPFIFDFSLQYDPKVVGVLGLSLNKYDQESSGFTQSALYRSPQDGLTQILAVVESGVYAVGIQTLTSTSSMFLDGGLGSEAKGFLGHNILHEGCLGVRYSYLVASSMRGDSRTLVGGALGLLALLAGDGLGSIQRQADLDSKFLDEVGEASLLADCQYDDLPAALPQVEAGFDRSFTLLAQGKPADYLDIVVERASLMRVSIHSSSAKNQVSAFLLEHAKDREALAWTTGSGNTQSFLIKVEPRKRAYTLKLEYDTLDQDDACPTFDLRIILKPVDDAVSANLHCAGAPLPPQSLTIKEDDFESSAVYSFGSDFIQKVTDQGGALEYDIALKWPTADASAEYYLDVESKSDVLTGSMTYTLLYEKKDKSLGLLGRSHPVGSSAHGSRFTQRLKLLDQDGELAEDVQLDAAILRLRFPPSSVHLFDVLQQDGHLGEKEICHTFSLSVRAELRTGENESGLDSFGPSRLVRVRWEGEEVNGGLYDPSARIYAALEFDRSMKSAFKMLKEDDFVTLEAAEPHVKTVGSRPVAVKPSFKSLSTSDPSTILLEFHGGSLESGWCHKLAFRSAALGPFGKGPDFDAKLLASDLHICASNCLCNWKGTERCSEEDNMCTCRFPYTGKDCSQCQQGHTLDAATGECTLGSKCADAGGSETCNGHGQCEQKGQHASCQCDLGFVDDGLERCAKCTDPLFDYPECQLRNWVLEDPPVNCQGLEYKMPRKLWRDSASPGSTEPLQGEDGEVNWAQRYRLSDGKTIRKASSHYFIVPETSVFRLHFDTSRSGVLVKYRLFNDDSEELLSSTDESDDESDADGYTAFANDFLVVHQPEGKSATDAPFKLKLEYKHDSRAKKSSEQACPVVDIHVIVEPLLTAREALRCSEEELTAASKQRTTGWQLDSQSKFISEEITLKSNDETLYTQNGKESSNFGIINYDIDIRSAGNALSIVATYPFSEVEMSIGLYDKQTGGVIAVERTSSLEGDRESGTPLSAASDMATFIEVPWIDEGRYKLQIILRRSLFLPTKAYPTCVAFGLVVEYVSRSSHKSDAGLYEILSVYPLALKHLEPKTEKVIDVHFDRTVVLDDLVDGLPERFYICQLINTHDEKDIIHPHSVRVDSATALRLDFDFSKAVIQESNRCYTLKCSTKYTKGVEAIAPMQEETSYCFETKQEQEHSATSLCNPLAQPKLAQSGRCICAAPYTGHDCESCEDGFKRHIEKAGQTNGRSHTRCVPDLDHPTATSTCNSHGRPQQSRAASAEQVTCDCDKGYGGRYCDYCTDSSLAYPDCDAQTSSSIYDSDAVHAYLSRRKYEEQVYSTTASKYFAPGSLEPTVFNEECGWVDFPDDLDRAELSREFSHGDFHIADLYVVNHRQDNIMKFVPRSEGVLKFLVQQPEAEEEMAGDAEAAFDIEVGIYDPEAERFLTTGMNRHLILPSGSSAKLEYAQITFEVNKENIQKPLYVFFRALNFTDDGTSHRGREGCLALYIEAEFRASDATCGHYPTLQPSSQIISLKDQGQAALVADAARGQGEGAPHSIADPRNTFFTYQDYFVPQNSAGDADWEVMISLQQKFVEHNTLDILVEVLSTDTSVQELDPNSFSPRPSTGSQSSRTGLAGRHHDSAGSEQTQGSLGPRCAGVCLVGGEKAFNEMVRSLELSAGTYFRVWLMQETPPNRAAEAGWCANYQLLVSAKQVRPSPGAAAVQEASLQCQAEELPTSLNTHRYLLGLKGEQKDFHYRQSYRVDHLWHNEAHQIAFKLQEPSLVRIVAPVHRHLDFVLILNQDIGEYSHKTVLTAQKEDFHSTIFAQLAPGNYHLKLAFVSDAALLQQPCQTVQLEMAIMTITNAKVKAAAIKTAAPESAPRELNLSQLFLRSATAPLALFRPAALGWRHVEPGLKPYVDQRELYIEILREGFEISEEDDAGLDIELHSDFLLSGVMVAINNVATGQILEDERKDSSSKLLVGHLVPGAYELIVYTHESVTNMDPEHGVALTSFDLSLTMSVRLVRTESSKGVLSSDKASVAVELLDYSSSSDSSLGNSAEAHIKEASSAVPLVLTKEELACLKDHLPLPLSLDALSQVGFLDLSESFYSVSNGYFSHEIVFTARTGQDALRVFLARPNSKAVLVEASSRAEIAHSRPQDSGRAQLLLATDLRAGESYKIILEFSEESASRDGEAARDCEHFIMAVKTWDSGQVCLHDSDLQDYKSLPAAVTVGAEPEPHTVVLTKQSATHDLHLQGDGNNDVDLTITLDYSDAFYKPQLSLKRATSASEAVGSSELEDLPGVGASIESLLGDPAPARVDFSRKQSTTYYFTDLGSSEYQLKISHRAKTSGCAAPLTITVHAKKAWSASVGEAGEQSRSFLSGSSRTLYQSAAEEQETPRTASKLPLNLATFKFTGGQSHSSTGTASGSGYLLFTGPVQLDELESQNRITFEVAQEGTLVRFYAEHEGLSMTLSDSSSDHTKTLATGSGASLMRMLGRGQYALQLSVATAHGRKAAAIAPPATQLTIVMVDADTHSYYNETWAASMGSKCEGDSNFPLALRQQRQSDSHQLYYNYPLVKVSPTVLQSKAVLQTYNLRINVTSRLYFEVGMHLINDHVTLQLTTLGSSGYAIQGKQRGNLNVLDIELGPGDYSIALKQVSLSGRQYVPTCGLFSLQGLVEPIDLMSAAANSGEILQRGALASCPEAADGDILPPKIFGSKSSTRGGGELHVDASGHFMRRFRNVLFKQSRDLSASDPLYDYVELEPKEDSLLHLAFLYDAIGGREIRVTLTDTWMMGQSVTPSSDFKLDDIEGGHTELITEYKLTAGRHYHLTVYYVGGGIQENEAARCGVYDVTFSISHISTVKGSATCDASKSVESLNAGLQHVITDKDLDHTGKYSFDKTMRLQYPHDFKKLTKIMSGKKETEAVLEWISIDLGRNYNLRTSLDFEFDEALFTLGFTESRQGEEGDWDSTSSLQQGPLVFKGNDDHSLTVRRELVADDVQKTKSSHQGHNKQQTLQIVNRQPEILKLLGGNEDTVCIFVRVQIHIQAEWTDSSTMYAAASKGSSVAPMLQSCRPDESPAFLHGRPSTVHFNLQFSKRPYLHHHSSEEKEDENSIAEAMRLKLAIISLADSERSEILVKAQSVSITSKEYETDEYHIQVNFDISEYGETATEKPLHAQLVVLTTQLVDEHNEEFKTEKALASRGLPIYVFEQNDEEQLLSEETNEIREAVADEVVGVEAERVAEGLSQTSADAVPSDDKLAECLCVHGTCRTGETTCSGRCEDGWTGETCATPVASNLDFKAVARQSPKDYTSGGLYRPQTISDQSTSNRERPQRASSTGSSHRAKQIESSSSPPPFAPSLQEQIMPFDEPTVLPEASPESDSEWEKNASNYGVIVLVLFVLYALLNGLSCPEFLFTNASRQRGQRGYRGLGERNAPDNDDSDEDQLDSASRRKALELQTFGKSDMEANDSKQPQNLEMQSVAHKKNEDDEAATELQRELELFAQDDDSDEDSSLIQIDSKKGPQQRKGNKNTDPEIQEYQHYFETEKDD